MKVKVEVVNHFVLTSVVFDVNNFAPIHIPSTRHLNAMAPPGAATTKARYAMYPRPAEVGAKANHSMGAREGGAVRARYFTSYCSLHHSHSETPDLILCHPIIKAVGCTIGLGLGF